MSIKGFLIDSGENMVLQTDAVQQNCRSISRQVRDHMRTLNLSFIVHHSGQHLEALSLASQELLTHPAAEAALHILKKPSRNEQSGLLGIVTWRESLFFGLASRTSAMALNTLNIDDFSSLRDVRAHAWHDAWYALNLMGMRNRPRHNNSVKDSIMLPDLDEMIKTSWNLRADVFSAIMSGLNGDKHAIHHLAHARSEAALKRNPGHTPEYYPFPIAMEATVSAYAQMMRHPPSKRRQIAAALKIAETVGNTYDELALQQWIYFCKPAQDMAWRGDPAPLIIGAAVSTSQDTYVRATGFLVSEILQIKPTSIINVQEHYSPFAEERYNKRLHETMMERTFQNAVSAGLSDASANPFLDAANKQNQRLVDGHILGWCAAALQAAGRAFENAIASGSKTPDQAARREFDFNREKTTWDSLRDLGENIVEHYRRGETVTFGDILDFCGRSSALAGVSNAVAFTMKDPGYLKKLDIANDLSPSNIPAPAPAAAPKAPAPAMPAPAMPAPGMGGGSARPVQQRPIQQRTPPPDEDDKQDT